MDSIKKAGPIFALLAAASLALYFGVGWLQEGPSPLDEPASLRSDRTASLDQFPSEERDAIASTLASIDSGGPFLYARDGATFGNREGRLPNRPSGYYREYTVETPGSPDRGARRIVAGQGGEIYYTNDHYESFVRIR